MDIVITRKNPLYVISCKVKHSDGTYGDTFSCSLSEPLRKRLETTDELTLQKLTRRIGVNESPASTSIEDTFYDLDTPIESAISWNKMPTLIEGDTIEVDSEIQPSYIDISTLYKMQLSILETAKQKVTDVQDSDGNSLVTDTIAKLPAYEKASNKTTVLSTESTDDQYPSAKAVYDATKEETIKGYITKDYIQSLLANADEEEF